MIVVCVQLSKSNVCLHIESNRAYTYGLLMVMSKRTQLRIICDHIDNAFEVTEFGNHQEFFVALFEIVLITKSISSSMAMLPNVIGG